MNNPRPLSLDACRNRIRHVLEGVDVQLAATALHELTAEYFRHYAGEVASAQYNFGYSAGREDAGAKWG